MKEWEYTRLMNRNYLQVKIEQEEFEDKFPYRMIMSETIKGLLTCRLREWNGMDFLLYDISSMQSMSSLYAEKKMDFLTLRHLIYCIERSVKNVREYLLEEEHLRLYPEFIFQEIDSKEIKLLYYPGIDEGGNESGKKFYDFLLAIVDHEDDALVEILYQIYELLDADGELSWIEILNNKLCQEEEKREGKRESLSDEKEKFLKEKREQTELENELSFEMYSRNQYKEYSVQNEKGEFKEKCKKGMMIFAIYIIAMGGAIYYLYSNYVLDFQENIITWSALVLVTAIIIFWMFIWLKKESHKQKANLADERKQTEKEILAYTEMGSEELLKPELYGKTIYFEAEENEDKLYGVGKKNRRTIQMDKFPFVIGKKTGSVDGVLDDASISRIHARFYKREDVLWMEDLNSTNGTYKNGIMLTPHEQVEVLPEDEIRFGKLQFIYR